MLSSRLEVKRLRQWFCGVTCLLVFINTVFGAVVQSTETFLKWISCFVLWCGLLMH